MVYRSHANQTRLRTTVALHLEPSERHHRCRPVRVAHHAQIDRIERCSCDWPQVLCLFVEVTIGCGQCRLVVAAERVLNSEHGAAQVRPTRCCSNAANIIRTTNNKHNKLSLRTGRCTYRTARMYRHTHAHARRQIDVRGGLDCLTFSPSKTACLPRDRLRAYRVIDCAHTPECMPHAVASACRSSAFLQFL